MKTHPSLISAHFASMTLESWLAGTVSTQLESNHVLFAGARAAVLNQWMQ